MKKEYLVLTIEVFAGDGKRFYIDAEVFTNQKDAEKYLIDEDQKFVHQHFTFDEDGEVVHEWEREFHSDWHHEYWWNGTSHRCSEIIEVEPDRMRQWKD